MALVIECDELEDGEINFSSYFWYCHCSSSITKLYFDEQKNRAKPFYVLFVPPDGINDYWLTSLAGLFPLSIT
jgi:hypothetical protein